MEQKYTNITAQTIKDYLMDIFYGKQTRNTSKEINKNITKKNMRVGMSGYKGVSKASRTDKFEAYLTITSNNKFIKKHIGTFPTISAAHIARLKYIDSLK